MTARRMEAARLLYENGCETKWAENARLVEAIERHAGSGTLARWCVGWEGRSKLTRVVNGRSRHLETP